jgi:hypothetical protein
VRSPTTCWPRASCSPVLVRVYPWRFDGALPFCGILGGAVGLWNQNLDLQYAIKTLLSADPNPAVSGPASQPELVHITDWWANIARANAADEPAPFLRPFDLALPWPH